MSPRILSLALLAAFVLGSEASAQQSGAGPVLSFGVVPQQAASRLAKLWVPVLSYLSDRTGASIEFHTAPDIPEFESRVAKGEYDLVYMNPYHYTVFHENAGYEAFARQKDHHIVGILVVPNDSPIQDITELAGQTLAFPAPAAFAASVLPRASLRAQGVTFTAKFVASHDSVYQSVAQGLYPAGGGIESTLSNTNPDVRAKLRVLWRTPAYTPHAFAVHPRVSAELRERVAEAMYAMANDREGRARLAAINFAGIVPARDGDWDGVRALNIDALDKP